MLSLEKNLIGYKCVQYLAYNILPFFSANLSLFVKIHHYDVDIFFSPAFLLCLRVYELAAIYSLLSHETKVI